MTVMVCPKCNKRTFFQTPMGRMCTKCGYEMLVPVNREGRTGENPYIKKKGGKCSYCGKNSVCNNMCKSCGAIYREGIVFSSAAI